MERVNLKVFRVKNLLTQEEMAQKIGLSRYSYIMLESGKRDFKISTLKKFKKAFNLTEDEMIKLIEKGDGRIER